MTLRLVSRDALAPASLFCQEGENRWQDVFLNRTIYGQEDGNLLSGYVNRLRVERDMDEEELGDFYSTVARMDKLERLDWTVSILQGTGVDWYGTLVRLCQELPKLRSLSLTLAQNEIPLGALDKIVPLTNLLELSITLDGSIDEVPDNQLPNTLVELIQGAANIESLDLVFVEGDDTGEAPWGSIDLFRKLSPHWFPNLRMLKTESLYLVPIDNYGGLEFRQFIRGNKKLEKICLLMGGYDNTPDFLYPFPTVIPPADMEEMMPSIRHFGGPGVLVGELLKSGLTKQLQLLELREPALSRLGGLRDVLLELDDSIIVELPSLKGLSYSKGCEEDDGWGAITDLLSKLSTGLLALQELVLARFDWPKSSHLDQLLGVLQQLPHIRRLTIDFEYPLHSTCEVADAIQRFYQELGAPCPELDIGVGRRVDFSPYLLEQVHS
ncbi:hypothetical protein BN14_03191 [Rhizoctonia solani AG-1 IB]|uniref:Uncharacterized protein n=1 Tax=Thanatephorus cucumeris (strain AG1-IB / isolate 7/3/14) TaxID=1108050 RepID=M5BZT8_THACB|nr:hypothetical protein BN14_03191 [Rhizoctonia solani AG-1 IB]